eukprot:8129099-Pyramimonas_sp.AAC.1
MEPSDCIQSTGTAGLIFRHVVAEMPIRLRETTAAVNDTPPSRSQCVLRPRGPCPPKPSPKAFLRVFPPGWPRVSVRKRLLEQARDNEIDDGRRHESAR